MVDESVELMVYCWAVQKVSQMVAMMVDNLVW